MQLMSKSNQSSDSPENKEPRGSNHDVSEETLSLSSVDQVFNNLLDELIDHGLNKPEIILDYSNQIEFPRIANQLLKSCFETVRLEVSPCDKGEPHFFSPSAGWTTEEEPETVCLD